jgi:hypothetical protein
MKTLLLNMDASIAQVERKSAHMEMTRIGLKTHCDKWKVTASEKKEKQGKQKTTPKK